MPGFHDVQHMTNVLIRERAPAKAHVLVHGAGGGLELEAFANANPDWTFTGVDPALPMLEEARKRLVENTKRAQLHHGYIDTAPTGPFDAATSLLTLHFLDADARRDTVRQIVQRLKPGAPFIAVHTSIDSDPERRRLCMSRYAGFAVSLGVDPDMASAARDAVAGSVPILDPETDAAILRDAGLIEVTEFYSAFTWRGWVGYAP